MEAWQAVTDFADGFKSADKSLFSLPMWNFAVPYKLKHFFDVLVQPGLAFSFSPETGPVSWVTGKLAVGIYARGFTCGLGSGQEKSDFQVPCMHQILGYIGFTDIKDIIAEPTAMDPAAKEKALAAAMRQATQLAATI